jgi:hypothetical protein
MPQLAVGRCTDKSARNPDGPIGLNSKNRP